MDNRLLKVFGSQLRAEVCKAKEFRRGGVLVFEAIMTEYAPGQSMMVWMRQPVTEKFIDGFENAGISCRYKRGDAVDEDQARVKIARRFDDYWQIISQLAPAEERHGTMSSEEKRRL